ncbi:MAG: response regulator transcription factor, partial [Bacteroidales bacterium]|nr:response regulator transcription factor [Bacteroidales bacterium]
LELFLMLSGKSKTVRVLMVNVQPEDEIIFEMHRLGVTGLLSTKADGNEFVKAVAAMIEEGMYFSPILAEKIFFHGLKTNMQTKHKVLSVREIQVMLMLGNGSCIKEIAERIYLSDKTVSTYKSRVYQKMGFKNDSQLIRYLLKHRFL